MASLEHCFLNNPLLCFSLVTTALHCACLMCHSQCFNYVCKAACRALLTSSRLSGRDAAAANGICGKSGAEDDEIMWVMRGR